MIRLATLVLALAAIALAPIVMRAFDGPSDVEVAPTASRRSATEAEVSRLEQQVHNEPQDADALTRLAAAYLQRARETGDPSYYTLADTAVERAIAITPNSVRSLVVSGSLALARHDFEGALEIGERTLAINPDVVAAYGIITDALVELGRYDEALATAQAMVDRRPDFASYSRVSYLRELHGDIDGAVEAMRQAADAGSGIAYDEAWALVIVGNLHLVEGDIDAASAAYREADSVLPADALTLAGLARLSIAQGDLARAETLLREAVEKRPLPEYAIALGDLLWSQGRMAEADEQYALVRAAQQLSAANGVDTDLELALFDADHGADPGETFARALAAYERRPSIYAADILAWTAYRAGRYEDAQTYIKEAQRLGTRDPRLSYHAGVISQAVGDDETARRHFADALAMQRAQSLRYAGAARDAAEMLDASVAR
jgi:tetratricopeptide (TPR) repeat protein